MRSEVSKFDDWDIATMVAISKAESGCRADAVGDRSIQFERNGRMYGYSIGALQVRILPGREWCEEEDNYWECAHAIYKTQGYRAWSVYQNGAYRKFL